MIDYTLAVSDPAAHLVEVEVVARDVSAPLELIFPTWTPGSYLVREHARHVQWLRAEVGAAEKLAKDRWRIVPEAGAIRIRYALYANDLTVRTNHVDATHAFVNPAAALPYLEGRRQEACRLTVRAPPGWNTACALPLESGALLATDYDELADSPIHLAPITPAYFSVRGVPHELWIWGEAEGATEPARLTADLARILEVQAQLFGGLPYQRYVFILMLDERARGGLEHRASCALLSTRGAFRTAVAYEDLLLLAAHEAFHLWNVKRIKPAAFEPYDYTRECYTRLLWAMEGLTSFYEVSTVRRAGLISDQRAFEIWGERITQLLRTPGRLVQPLADASFDAWIKYYRADEQSPGVQISYYLKGSIVGLLLDLTIRQVSNRARSLDDVMRLLWERFGARGLGMPEDAVEQAASEVAGVDLRAFFDRALRSTEELDIAGALAGMGLRLGLRVQQNAKDKGGRPPKHDPEEREREEPRAWLGAELKSEGHSLRFAVVLPRSPASAAGLSAGDELVAVDGFRVDARNAEERLLARLPGSRVGLHVFRRGKLLEVAVALAAPPLDTAWIEVSTAS